MANKDLYGKTYTVPNDVISSLSNEITRNKNNKSLKGYKRAQNIVNDRAMSYSMLKRMKNFLTPIKAVKVIQNTLLMVGKK